MVEKANFLKYKVGRGQQHCSFGPDIDFKLTFKLEAFSFGLEKEKWESLTEI